MTLIERNDAELFGFTREDPRSSAFYSRLYRKPVRDSARKQAAVPSINRLLTRAALRQCLLA
jgi:hypothetical protein